MAFEIIDETYVTLDGQDPRRWGYVEGYTSNTIGETYLRLNVKSIPDQDMYDHAMKVGLGIAEFKVGQPHGEGVRLTRRQVKQLIWELIKWLVKGR